LGDHVYYSGTVGAALEAARLGMPAIAVSLVTEREQGRDAYWHTAVAVIEKFLKSCRPSALPAETILNINVPNAPKSFLKGWRICPLARSFGYRDTVQVSQTDPSSFVVTNVWETRPEPGLRDSDLAALQDGYVAVTPLVVRPYSTTLQDGILSLPKWSTPSV